MKVLVIDNYDSFVYNLVHYIEALDLAEEITVVKNDAFNIEQARNFDKILLSPGPGIPKEAGIMPEIIRRYAGTKSILGVCLGHQAIAECFGAELFNLPFPLHGIASQITVLEDDYLFKNIPKKFNIGHYHSWVARIEQSDHLAILALDENQNIMALRHKEYDVRGVQFHPESILTEHGKTIIKNWLEHFKNS